MGFCIWLWFKFFLDQFDFYFPLFQIMVMNLTEREIKIKLVKKMKPKKGNLNYNIDIVIY